MPSKTSWIILLAVGAVVFAASAVWWANFLSDNLCHDAGGIIRNGECVGAAAPITLWWDAPWDRIAYTLVPAGVVAIIVVAVIWVMGREKEAL